MAERKPVERTSLSRLLSPLVLKLLQLRVFRLGSNKNGDVGVGVFPEREEIRIFRRKRPKLERIPTTGVSAASGASVYCRPSGRNVADEYRQEIRRIQSEPCPIRPGSAAAPGGRGVNSRSPKMKESGSNENDVVVIAVLSVEEARVALLSPGLFEVCPGSDDAVIDKENGIQVRLVTISSGN
jgi:hypothetical protein